MADSIEPAQSAGRKIMICIDGSNHSRNALDWYINNIRRDDDELLVVHAPELHPPALAGALVSEAWHQEVKKHEEKIENLIHSYKELVKEKCKPDCKYKVYPVAVNYRAADALCHEAKKNHVNMMIVGSRGMGLIRRTLIGSVSDYIIHHAHCPVVVVRNE